MPLLDDILRMLSGYGRDFGSLFDPENYDNPLEVLRRAYMRDGGEGAGSGTSADPSYRSDEILAPFNRPSRPRSADTPGEPSLWMTLGGRNIEDERGALTGGFGLPQGIRREGGGFSAPELTDEAREQGWGMPGEEFLAQLGEAAKQKKREDEDALRTLELEAARLELAAARRREDYAAKGQMDPQAFVAALIRSDSPGAAVQLEKMFAQGGRGATDEGGGGGAVVPAAAERLGPAEVGDIVKAMQLSDGKIVVKRRDGRWYYRTGEPYRGAAFEGMD